MQLSSDLNETCEPTTINFVVFIIVDVDVDVDVNDVDAENCDSNGLDPWVDAHSLMT